LTNRWHYQTADRLQTRAFATAAFAVTALAVNTADTSGISFIDTTTKGRLQIVGVE
jgi:hypothetical protein